MTGKHEASPGARLCPIYLHRTTDSDQAPPDRYLYTPERIITRLGDAFLEYAGTTRLAFYASTAEADGAVPVYLKSREGDGNVYFKLSLTEGPEEGYEPVGEGPWFWGFDRAASPACAVSPVYEHGVPADSPGYPRYYYDQEEKSTSGWSDGRILFWAVSPPAFFERALRKFFEEDQCPQRALDATGVPGMAVGLVHGDAEPFCRGYGLRDLSAPGAGVDENTIFQLASVSKPIASTIVAALVGQNYLGWDDTVSTYLPDFDIRNREASVADMLAHCSGLPEHAGDLLEDIGYGRGEVLRRLRYLPCVPPGTHDWYTNFGFTAGAVAAAAAYSKKSGRQTEWEDLAAEQLYTPLGMARTTSHARAFKDDHNRAAGHQRFARYPGQWEWTALGEARDPRAQSPAGGVRSCVRDMAKWMRLQLDGGRFGDRQLVSAEALAKTHQRYRSPGSKFGLGWDVGEAGDVSHSGAFLLGAATSVRLWPDADVGLVVLTNGEPVGLPEALSMAFRDYLTGHELPGGASLDLWLARVGKALGEIIPAPKDMGYGTWVSDAPRPLEAYCGAYAHEYYGEIVVALDGGGEAGSFRRLKLSLGPQRREVILRMWDGDTFVYQTFGENAVGTSAVEFEFDEAAPQRAARVRVRNLHFSATNPHYSETDPEAAESAWFTR